MSTDNLKQAGEEALRKLREPSAPRAPRTTEPSPAEAEITARERAAKKARLAQVLTRGITGERFKVAYNAAVPDGYAGKFVRNNEGDIIRYTNLGYGFTYREGASRLDLTADNRVRVGDLVLMTISKDDLEILREIKQERIKYKVGKQGRQEYMREAEQAARDGGPIPFDEGTTNINR